MTKRKFTIEQARIIGGFNQSEMSKALDMSEKTYIKYEKYRKIFRMDHAIKFSTLTEIALDDIIFFADQLQKECS